MSLIEERRQQGSGGGSRGSGASHDLLFDSGAPWFPLLVGAVTLGAAVMGMVRGMLTARQRFAALKRRTLSRMALIESHSPSLGSG